MNDLQQNRELLLRRDYLEGLIYDDGRRFTQHSPILPDVWIGYGLHPHEPQDLLLTPEWKTSPGTLAQEIKDRLAADRGRELLCGPEAVSRPRVAFNQSSVAVTLWFDEMMRVALPLSSWWHRYLSRKAEQRPVERYLDEEQRPGLQAELARALSDLKRYDVNKGAFTADLIWLARIAGLLALLGQRRGEESPQTVDDLERLAQEHEAVARAFLELFAELKDVEQLDPPPLWSVNRNRPTAGSIYRSVPAIKADAAQHLFEVRGKGIRWAVIDSGIDARHLAFRRRRVEDGRERVFSQPFEEDETVKRGDRWRNHTRILGTYDFTCIRDLLSADSVDDVPPELRERCDKADLRQALKSKTGRMVNWELFEPVLRIPHETPRYRPPEHPHGTHVAGILGADWRCEDCDDGEEAIPLDEAARPTRRTGICPEIELYDLRALDDRGAGDEFSIMAALQFVRFLNGRQDHPEIHGVNLSFAIEHDVSNYACGRTPVCDECERLVGSGVVVVAAAGNSGRARYLTTDGRANDGYRTVSITDPGNAEAVITVGATHRSDGFTYGVSYFSSRGPTGDGRLKPDLVAPGEKIRSTIPGNREESLDGTSQAAPHVSGAAALLMDRNRELIGRPHRVKEILCKSATDLGRERYFQGAGLVDILRALQSI